jgi:phage baseplate assembly protein V
MALMVGRCVLLAVNDAPGVQQLQIRALEGEVLDRVERHQEYGFTSHPQPGAEGVVVAVGGLRSHAIVIAVEDRRYRLTGLKAGEVALHDDQGQAVHLMRDGIELRTTRPDGVRISAPKVRVEATQATVKASSISLGDGDLRPVARVGDPVMISSGSSAGLTGVIHAGSDITRSA